MFGRATDKPAVRLLMSFYLLWTGQESVARKVMPCHLVAGEKRVGKQYALITVLCLIDQECQFIENV